ncbi:TMV resistance protein N-like [Macadamia integrifolia]|uniref:TMV resistance protein N-like n=1 Tax=Macadamia integrifolia TaxID=60698 RepID=UPI001C530496|nr:TMV resistance protein N-like [Macadamia integrifolia]XP_042480559.1 TMV resistance protein N-like [Macadamia integrifolia]XP_042480560.1 TMV resistance protein N-like [Macadamia integrifolia]XP_042480561.1 TMV resistance protein N-like [Macadamia integrifolia]
MADNMTNEASSSSHRWIYDVYLNFYSLDTRRNFIHYLHKELSRNGIYTFLDEEELKGGENITAQILEAIEGSRIAIIVFSENYASSPWCLRELTSILDRKKIGRIQEVLPVFYKVDPSDVRHQRNTYAKALERHEERYEKKMVERWKAALKEAANLSGWDQVNIANGYETELTKIIVEEVLKKVENILLFDVACTIGLDFHTKHIGSLLNDGLDVRIVGIYGPGGIGKTAIAKAVFKDMFTKFEGSSFLRNVGELSSNHKCLAFLQRMLLTDIFRGINIDIDYEDKGIIIIKERLCHKKVLIVLDDVDEMRQFYKLVGGHGCLGPGSRIILTTRDEHLLNKLDVDERYMVKTMNQSESLQLFSFHAFQQKHPPQGYEQLSNDVIHYAGGLPFALEILGSSLWKKHQNVWKEVLKKLRESPNYEIFEKLKISYDVLDDFNQAIFLDISCFFIGKDKKFVIRFLDACGLGGEIGIKILTERSLITINEDNRLCMHNIIRGMGREIVHKESFQHPGKRSRLWNHHDVLNVLQHRTGTDAVEGLQLKGNEFSPLSIEGFFSMPNLRLLKVNS